MLAGSIYYHHGSKDDLLLAIYEIGVDQVVEEFNAAVSTVVDPWQRLCAVTSSHIGAITRKSPYMRVINRVLPENVPKHAEVLAGLRGKYENCIRSVVDELPFPPSVDRSLLRLMILGAVNQTQFWFDPKGPRTPAEIGEAFTRFLVDPIAPVSRNLTTPLTERDANER